MTLFDLTGTAAIVTGGYGHLGTAMCTGLAEHGASVYVLGRSEERFAAAFPQAGNTVSFVNCDITNTGSVKDALAQVHERAGSIGVLVNNAVRTDGQGPLDLSDEQWTRSLDSALTSVYRCTREIVPHLRDGGGGSIINISSMYGLVSPDFSLYRDSPAYLNPPHYGAAKAGVVQLTKYFAWYLGPEGIRVNAVAPGPFPNPMVQKDEAFVSRLCERTALKRIGQPQDLKGALVYLASSASSYVTGQTLVVDGGWTTS